MAIGVALAKTAPTNLIPNDSAPVAPTLAIPGDVTIGPVHTAFAGAVPVDPDPVNPSALTKDGCKTATHTLVNCSAAPANSIPADSNPVICVDPIDTTPAEPVHVDPVAGTPITLSVLASTFFTLIFILLE
jgi:hypothetical protein